MADHLRNPTVKGLISVWSGNLIDSYFRSVPCGKYAIPAV